MNIYRYSFHFLFIFLINVLSCSFAMDPSQEEGNRVLPVTFSNKKLQNESAEEANSEKKFPQTEGSPHKAKWGVRDNEVEEAFANSKYLISIMEFGGSFKRLNKKWEETLGWTIEELMNTPYYNFIHPEDREKTVDYEKHFIPAGFVNRWRHKDGSYRWLNWVGLLNFDLSEGHAPFSIAIDVTLDEILKEEGKKQISLLNENLRFQSRVIKAVVDIQRLYLGELGRYGDEKDPEISFAHIIQHFVRLSESEFGFIASLIEEDKKIIMKHKTWEVHPDLKLEDQKLFEECREEKEGFSYLNHLLNEVMGTRKPVIVNNTEGSFEATGPSEQSILFKSFLGMPLVSRNELVGIVALVNRSHSYNQQLIEWLEPLFLLGGRIINEVNLLGFRKKAEVEYLERTKAEAKSEAKSSFLAHMSHEIRTPLTGLLGTLELINQEYLHEEDIKYLSIAHSSGLALLSILNDVLDIAKIEAKQIAIESIQFNPLNVAQEVVHLSSLEAQRKGLDIKLIVSPHIPPSLIGDPTRLRQIFFNLVSNALKFTNKGSVVVTLEGKHEEDYFRFCGSVSDTGIGMSAETQEKLFSSFFQSDSSILRKFGGTGLGLFITKQLCELMGGGIKVISEFNKGSTFNFNVQLGYLKELSPHIGMNSSIDLHTKLPDNTRILIAEDNAVNQLVLKTMLTKSGCKNITTVWNGEEAVNALATGHYDIVLMDGEMPIMDGLEATQKIREKFPQHVLPIIGVTAHALAGDAERFLKAGMNGYLTKPIQKESLYIEILKCLASKQSTEQEKTRDLRLF